MDKELRQSNACGPASLERLPRNGGASTVAHASPMLAFSLSQIAARITKGKHQ